VAVVPVPSIDEVLPMATPSVLGAE
jgi:hypothetical protein